MTNDKGPRTNSDEPENWENPPAFIFRVFVDDEPKAQVFGPQDKRNWVLWKLSQYAIAFEDEGIVSVKRFNNGKWENADDWRNLAH
ncbi:hypothetical protein FDH38_gp097 [Dinoroseobacter phage vB_DshS-R5C]|uniref:Uncharacterized protein n=1 Tax=Dinoroseobacter phage vB_DshS-R5C TaxID=1965368 RepID=A0A1V0DYC1_9CAUD|nr:hypothetical protein FDH38_gp097 [Dinoroseobacter phage vB_DshS-R5C]ARB06151.1 hypothetical protein vBDshSR5C_97 [Dinoroseobacter phage vB_DshS-R5C]